MSKVSYTKPKETSSLKWSDYKEPIPEAFLLIHSLADTQDCHD